MWPFTTSNSEPQKGCPYSEGQADTSNPILNKEVSSIPKSSGSNDNWVYPSQLQFFEAMNRKGHKPNPKDMNTIVPIHNAVNERAWMEIKKWEDGKSDCKVYLHSFKGRPNDRSPKAWLKTALGYMPPFDRHDWIIDRCGQRVRYVIDFYAGSNKLGLDTPSFYLDVRPAIDDLDSITMRLSRFIM
ncbi:hypothetical protein E3P89_02455 [Wallemia ichthyophaga]|uniref:Holocytochrome c-type synthase n=1 Tax=Wallemia ichthyophaga TaxID=245174 RepID=A0A4T0HC82_WALIC|nr:hypothetical protein E3P98_02389 [Wallemia ichthyophaga]TIA89953.1 hypothetical protein E3P97_02775 [Wallemia ichthyophaga]TIB05781.1 hypothetical protein E3P96_00923 [Wallemia ichthyophaga]TIB11244.1 hypothetical protein E3P90_02508 [Wallemia ichthyophaga]TIB12027.1 hypothetical protein E3P93_02405 [Wallemia ichthyophaga]